MVKNCNTVPAPDLHPRNATDFIIANADVTTSMKRMMIVNSIMVSRDSFQHRIPAAGQADCQLDSAREEYRKSPLSTRKRSRAGVSEDLPIRQKGSAPDSCLTSPTSLPGRHKKSRVEGHHELPMPQRLPTPPAPLSFDADRLLHLLKENPVSWCTVSAMLERNRQRKPTSGKKRSQDPEPAGFQRQYAPQSSATATHPMPEIGIRPSVSSEFGLPFKISEAKIRKRRLPSAIEVSERGPDSAYYTQMPANIDVNTFKMASAQFCLMEQAKEGENQLSALHNAQLGGRFAARSTRSKEVHAQDYTVRKSITNPQPTAVIPRRFTTNS
ncbi:MAG: hypothetical protein Q9221_000687 [Calogaya cf. arnoldii]